MTARSRRRPFRLKGRLDRLSARIKPISFCTCDNSAVRHSGDIGDGRDDRGMGDARRRKMAYRSTVMNKVEGRTPLQRTACRAVYAIRLNLDLHRSDAAVVCAF